MPFLDFLYAIIGFFHPPVLMATTGLLFLAGITLRFRARDSFIKWLRDLNLLGVVTEDELLRPWVSNAFHKIHITRIASWSAFAGAFLMIALQVPRGGGILSDGFVTLAAAVLSTTMIMLLTAPTGSLRAEYRVLTKTFPASNVPRIEEFRKIPHTPWNKGKK
jgi:hypothetical protein